MKKSVWLETWKDNPIHILDIEKMREKKCSRTALQDAANLARFLMNNCRGDSLELLLGAMSKVNLPYDAGEDERLNFVNGCLMALNHAEEWDQE